MWFDLVLISQALSNSGMTAPRVQLTWRWTGGDATEYGLASQRVPPPTLLLYLRMSWEIKLADVGCGGGRLPVHRARDPTVLQRYPTKAAHPPQQE